VSFLRASFFAKPAGLTLFDNRSHSDTVVVGGGLVGAAIAVGLAKQSHRVTVLDGGDTDFRSSRGNFGLVWVQGKGADAAPYSQWTGNAAKAWPDFAEELLQESGVDIQLQQTGGLDFCLNESEFHSQSEKMARVRQHTDGLFEYQMLDNKQLKELVPQVAASVYGASFSPQDGHVNPLKLLKALHIYMQRLGCDYRSDHAVVKIEPSESGFKLHTDQGVFSCERVVLAAGLANTRLAHQTGVSVPLTPNQGQLLITERVAPFLSYPSIHIRQTDEGSLQIGDSHADVGYDDSTALDVLAMISDRLLSIFPHLKGIHVLRSWSALRVMTPDGLPVYERSSQWPNATVVNCHSGVTLAAQHATVLANWIAQPDQGNQQSLINEFSAERFHV